MTAALLSAPLPDIDDIRAAILNLQLMNGGDHMFITREKSDPTWRSNALSRAARDREEITRLGGINAELLEALKAMLLQHGVRGGSGPSEQARAAIAKAEGK